MDIRRVRYDGQSVQIDFRKPNKRDHEVTQFSSKDAPSKGFKSALAKVGEIGSAVLSSPKKWDCYGITFSASGSLKIVGLLTVAAGAVSLNTPSLYFENEDNAGGPATLSKKDADAVQALCARAEEYVLGNREQPNLPGLEPGAEAAAETPSKEPAPA